MSKHLRDRWRCPSLIANLAAGDHVTHQSATRFGDLVFYLSANLS